MASKYGCRAAQTSDYKTIAAFPQNADELFFMFPHATFPLTADQLEASAKERLKPTVVTCEGKVSPTGISTAMQTAKSGSAMSSCLRLSGGRVRQAF